MIAEIGFQAEIFFRDRSLCHRDGGGGIRTMLFVQKLPFKAKM